MIKKFLKQLHVDAHVIRPDRLKHPKVSLFLDSLSLTLRVVFFLFYLHVRTKHKQWNLYTQALLLLRRPPCWKSTARHARRVRLD